MVEEEDVTEVMMTAEIVVTVVAMEKIVLDFTL